MSLRRKAIIFFMSFFVIWFVFIAFYLTGQVEKGYKEIETHQFEWQLKRVEHSVNDLLIRHEQLILDWAKWDDTYKYVQYPNNLYLEGIVESNHFEDQQMNYYAFYNVMNQLIYADGYDLEMHRKKAVPEELIELFPKHRNERGIFLIDGIPIVFITHDVTDNTGLEPSMGLLAFAYELTDTTFMDMSLYLQETITMEGTVYRDHMPSTEWALDPLYNDSKAYVNLPYQNSKGYLRIKTELDHAVARLGIETTNNMVVMFAISFLLLIGVVLSGVNNIVKRIGVLNKELLRIHDYKHLDERIRLESNDEIGSIRDHINELFDELQAAQQQLVHHATYDILTSVYNRRVGIEKLQEAMKRNMVDDSPLTIAFVDVDELKVVNDIFGHNAGDDYLVHVCQALKTVVASQETIARIGGDEFIMIFPKRRALDVQHILHPIDDQLNSVRESFNLPYEMGISIGIFEYSKGMTVEEFLEEADRKMYEEKLRHRKQMR